MTDEHVQRRLAAILSADVAGYSRLMGLDEVGTLARLRSCREDVIAPRIARHKGRLVKLIGDGALVEFASAVEAVSCAIEIQEELEKRSAADPDDRRIRFRIGINVGDIIVDGDDIYGDGVNVAARVESIADPGGICLSGTAYDQVRDKISVPIEDRGEQRLKNITRPIRVFRLMPGDTVPAGGSRPHGAVPSRPLPEKMSIAVLAFDNMSGNPDQEYFSHGISEDIITDLSKLADLHVIARNSSFVYKNRSVSIREVGDELGVRYVLEGSVRMAGNRVRVNAQLVDSADGGHIWADRFDRDLTDVFAVQDELTREIVSALQLTLTADDHKRLAQKRSVDPAAYNLFLRGREHAWSHTRAGNVQARELLQAALEIEPAYAAAHARIAFTHVIDYVNGWAADPERSLGIGLEMARQAVAMNGKEAHCHFALAVACLWNRELDRALEEAGHCLALEPNSAEGHLVMAHAQIFSSEPAAAVQTIDAYMRLDPHYPDIILQFLAEAHISLGRFEQAVEILQQRLERSPDSATAYALLASCYGNLNRIDEGRDALAKLMRIDPDFSVERRRRVLPFKSREDFERRVEGLRRVGLLR